MADVICKCLPYVVVAPPNATALFRYSSAPGSGKDTAEGKGVHREVESEGSRIAEVERSAAGQTLGPTDRNHIEG